MHSSLRLIAASLLCLTSSPAFAAFWDVSQTNIHADAIAYVQNEGIVSGYPDGTFRPEQTINRAEFTKIIVGALFQPAQIDELLGRVQLKALKDIPSDAWFARFVFFASAKGIIDGYPDGSFRPSQSINVAEASKILVNAFALPVTEPAEHAAWYKGFMNALMDAHALPSDVSDVANPVTRGQLAEMIYRLKTQDRTVPLPQSSSSSAQGSSSSSAVSSSSSVSSNASSSLAALPITYAPYEGGVIGQGSEIMLFFYASWHVPSQDNDKQLHTWYDAGPMAMPTFRVDYDSEVALKQTYGVQHQNSFLLLDGKGRKIKLYDNPTQASIRQILDGSVQF